MFHEICADDKLTTVTDCHDNVDELFQNEAAQLGFNAFTTYVVKTGGEGTVMTIMRLGVAVAATIDGFQEVVLDFLRT